MLIRSVLILGGIFNCTMGMIFIHEGLLDWFFRAAIQIENEVFGRPASHFLPQDPLHLLLIHGFGAAVLILGATLIYSARDPQRYRAFIFIDGMGRLVFGCLMMLYVVRFSLMRTIAIFAVIELVFALLYIVLTAKAPRTPS